MKNARFWRKRFFLYCVVVLSMFFVIGCDNGGSNSTQFFLYDKDTGDYQIVTVSIIEWGDVNPIVIITAEDFEFDDDITADDVDVLTGTTGLTFNSVTYLNPTQIRINFTGTAGTGKIIIEIDDADDLIIIVPHHIAVTSPPECNANPTVTLSGTDFKADISVDDLTVDVGTTDLTFDSVIFVSDTEIILTFTGNPLQGQLIIQANASAFDVDYQDEVKNSNTLFIGLCNPDPVAPWTTTGTVVPWLGNNPYGDMHDGGWVYSAREDVLYSMYGNNNSGRPLYRIGHIGFTSSLATTWVYDRHGSHPVIDDDGTYIYQPPSQNTNQLERYNTVTTVRETRAVAPSSGTFAHGTWKNGKLWITLNNNGLYSYDPATNTWSGFLYNVGSRSNVAASGPSSNLIYIIRNNGTLLSYDTTNGATTTLATHPFGFGLGGNGQFTWFGASTGFLYAVGGCSGTPAIYDISTNTWHAMSDPKNNGSCVGHATYDTSRSRLYVNQGNTNTYYYQY